MDAFRISADFTGLTGIGLKRGSVMRIHNGRGKEVRVERGTAWITQDGDVKDVVVDAGKSFRLERDGLTLITGFGLLTMIAVD
jgi:hypothetical protein